MKSYIKIIIILALSIINCQSSIVSAQVGINNDGSSPDASAMLDVNSTTQGMLVPRMTTSERDLINSPATGLMIYNNTTNYFNYYNGTSWLEISKDNLGNHTATTNLQLNNNWLSNDGDNEGVLISNTGQVGIGKMSTLNDLFQVTKEISPYTDLTTPSTPVTVSSYNTFGPENAIDNNRASFPWSSTNLPSWIKFDLGHAQTVTSYAIQCRQSAVVFNPNQYFRDWTFEGSNDNTSWTVLNTKSNFTFTTLIDTFMLSSPAHYQYYRLNGIQTNFGQVFLGEFELFGPPNVDVLAVTDAGDIRFNDAYVFPQEVGTNGQILQTNGSGELTWGNIDLRVTTNTQQLVLENTSVGQGSYIEVNNSTGTRALFGVDGNGYTGGDTTDVVLANWSNGDLVLFTNAMERMRIDSLGKIGIGRKATTNIFEVNGNASKASAGSWLANSDSRLKKNITPLSSEKMLNDLLALQGITYEWNDTTTGNNRPTEIQYGFTAQNIQAIFPTLVEEDNQGYLQTAYGTYDAMTVEAIRALNDKIERLEKENEDLKAQVAKINKLEVMLLEIQSIQENVSSEK